MSLGARLAVILASSLGAAAHAQGPLERVTTAVPYPRGLAMAEGKLYVLCRGRFRQAGGVTAAIDDQAGTIYAVDPEIAEPVTEGGAGERVRSNGTVFARPQEPPFRLWDPASDPPERDRLTDRPYCTLRYHEATRSFYICAFSGIDKPGTAEDPVAFSKNLADALLRFDLRTGRWHEVERHDVEAGGRYPHHDPQAHGAPAGWLNGPDNCLPLGRWLYAVAKDNSVLVRYDLGGLMEDPEAGHPPGEVVFGRRVRVEGLGERDYEGHSALAFHDGWLYVGYRTSSVVVRLRLDEQLAPLEPVRVQLVARFDPFDPATNRSANLTDMTFDERGRLYVLSATPARIFRFRPDPARVFDARDGGQAPWLDLARCTGNPAMKSENVLWEGGWLYVTSGDGYDPRHGTQGTVYRMRP